ncbi:MAG: winged helix-turn-helix transcriptional regulator [Rhodospirillales bacterium]|nr:winged helix-turn-helix transcriptional regulator [Alphaproteobacteria bacterium]MCB1840306.1 winged helix-turn-helix transcriptional regulator [Alphaproteobacteria bacterium]MCB9977526.1 winged helix-turn-helix transcriptional regulator [Rhodospirillales bacterium]
MDKFAALADPTRRRIMEMLAARRELAASEISREFSSTPSAISQHLKVLREAELVQMEKRAQQRVYSINTAEIEEMEQWLARMRKFWNDRFDALEALLKAEDDQSRDKKS